MALVVAGAIAAPLPAQDGPEAGAWPAQAGQYRFHMIGNGHIDPVWLWTWPEGVSVVHSTFRAALDRMKETPDFVFTASSSQFYRWVEQNDPAMLEEIRQRVREGRWVLAGGWWVEPDVNIPNGESLMRQGLYGQMTLRRLFGRTASFGYNPDSFGHPATLPQILKLQGMNNYVFMRPMPHEKKLPGSVFWWEAPDGSRVLTYRIPISYVATGDVAPALKRIISGDFGPVRDMMGFYGVGDHGGGPGKENIRSIQAISREKGAPKVLFSGPDRYFAEIRKDQSLDLPVVKDDLQIHAVGCYTALAEVKKLNRTTEAALQTAEKIASAAAAAWGGRYPKEEFTTSWEQVLLMQFHDSMAGTSLPEHDPQMRAAYGYAKSAADRSIALSVQKLAWQVPTEDPGSEYLLVFNPHAWAATIPVEYDLSWDRSRPSKVTDEAGREIAHQWTAGSTVAGDRRKLVFQAPLPAFGYRQFRVSRENGAAAPGGAKAEARRLENEHLRVTFGEDGGLAILDKDSGREVFQSGTAGGRALILDDPSDTWSHGVFAFTKVIGAFGGAAFRVLENGPMRAAIRVRTAYGSSRLQTDWFLYAGARSLEARVSLDWHEHQKMLKFSFPVDVTAPQATFEVPYGSMRRENDGHEYPGQRWFDVTGSRGGKPYGLTVINDAKYGYDVSGSDMRISIARGAVYAQHDPRKVQPDGEYIWQDQGIQDFRLLLIPHAGDWRDAAAARRAEEFTAPLPVMYQGIHPGHLKQSGSFLSVDAGNIVVAAMKQAEGGKDLILRCYETDGRQSRATIELPFVQRRWSGEFRPYEIKTLRVPMPDGAVREVNALEE